MKVVLGLRVDVLGCVFRGVSCGVGVLAGVHWGRVVLEVLLVMLGGV